MAKIRLLSYIPARCTAHNEITEVNQASIITANYSVAWLKGEFSCLSEESSEIYLGMSFKVYNPFSTENGIWKRNKGETERFFSNQEQYLPSPLSCNLFCGRFSLLRYLISPERPCLSWIFFLGNVNLKKSMR